MKRILLVGNLMNPHLIRLINAVKCCDNGEKQYEIDGFSFNIKTDLTLLKGIGYDNIYLRKERFPQFIYQLKKIRFLFSLIDYIVSFNNIISKYSLINIHYLTIESFFLYPFYRKKSAKIMISPWGSDVYRIPKYYVPFFKFLYQKIDYVSIPVIKFRYDVIDKFLFNSEKIIDLGFGSSMIDCILSNSSISRVDAQKKLGLDNKYVITCGYNANSNQQHIDIIKALCSIKDELPKNIYLIFLMTYNEDVQGYINKIEKLVNETGFSYRIYTDFLDDNSLFFIQKSTNLFVHIQKSDAFSAFVQENILCENIVVNGNWLRYPQLEKDSIPYYLLEDIQMLSGAILDIINKKAIVKISKATKARIKENAWSCMAQQWNLFYKNI